MISDDLVSERLDLAPAGVRDERDRPPTPRAN
jgi:hypothetical protein